MQHQFHASADSNHDSSDQIEEDEDVSMAPPSRQEPVTVKPEPMDISLSGLSEDSGRENAPGIGLTRKRRRERDVDAVFGESSSNPGPSTSFSARVKDEPGNNHSTSASVTMCCHLTYNDAFSMLSDATGQWFRQSEG